MYSTLVTGATAYSTDMVLCPLCNQISEMNTTFQMYNYSAFQAMTNNWYHPKDETNYPH